MRIMTYIFAFIMFACVGSFIGVCAYRIPKGEQILKGRSYCDECGRQLGALEMVPIISFIFYEENAKDAKKESLLYQRRLNLQRLFSEYCAFMFTA